MEEQPAVPIHYEYFIHGLDNPDALVNQDLQHATLEGLVDLALNAEKLQKV